MVADSRPPEPNGELLDDVTITIQMLRPREAILDRSISMKAETVGNIGVKEKMVTTGHHDDHTIKHTLQNVFDMYRPGRWSWAGRIDRDCHENGRDR